MATVSQLRSLGKTLISQILKDNLLIFFPGPEQIWIEGDVVIFDATEGILVNDYLDLDGAMETVTRLLGAAGMSVTCSPYIDPDNETPDKTSDSEDEIDGRMTITLNPS
jgi:hypothetical protein